MATKKHVHAYTLKNIGKNPDRPRVVYACNLPECTHFMPHAELLIGKKCLCHQCRKEFLISKEQIREKIIKLRCPNCRTKKKPIIVEGKEVKKESFDDAIASLLKGLSDG